MFLSEIPYRDDFLSVNNLLSALSDMRWNECYNEFKILHKSCTHLLVQV